MSEEKKQVKWADLPTIPVFKDISGIKAGQTVVITREDTLSMKVIGLSTFMLATMVHESLGEYAERNNFNMFFQNQPDVSTTITFYKKE